MAHFAELDSNNIVVRVIVVSDSDSGGGTLATENVGISFCKNIFGSDTNWKQTSYNNNFRGNYAGIGQSYMTGVRTLGVASTDVFMKPKKYASWEVGINTAAWFPPDPPGPMPDLTSSEESAGKQYKWSETNYNSNPSTAWVLGDKE